MIAGKSERMFRRSGYRFADKNMRQRIVAGRDGMAKTVEHVHWPDAPDMWMPY